MDIRKIKGKKPLKLLILLLTSLLIATASASVHSNMFMNATVGVTANKVQFWEGTDFTAVGGSITDNHQKVTFSSMDGNNGSRTTISDPVKINNTDTVDAHTIELKLDSWTGTVSTPMYYINITMYDASNNTKGATIHLVPDGTGQVNTTGDQSIGATEVWRVEWIIYWKGSASTETVDVHLLLVVKD